MGEDLWCGWLGSTAGRSRPTVAPIPATPVRPGRRDRTFDQSAHSVVEVSPAVELAGDPGGAFGDMPQLHRTDRPPVTEEGVLDRATSLPSHADEHSDPKRLERDLRRLVQARASLERLYLEMRKDLRESEHRNACATVRIRLLLRDAERRDREFARARRQVRMLRKDAERRDREYASARRLIRMLGKDAERRDREYAAARHRIRLLLNNAERRDREYASARSRVRSLLKVAERRDREYAQVRAQLRMLRHLSAGLAAAFLAITATRRWRLGNALLSTPSRLLGRRPVTVADDQRALATTLALGRMPCPPDSKDHENVGPTVDE